MSFQEFTFVEPENNTEVMICINVDNGRIENMYCYVDDIPKIIKDEHTEKYYKINTSPSKNNLFLNIKRKAHVFNLMLLHGGYISPLDEQDANYTENADTINKCLKRYGFSDSLHVY